MSTEINILIDEIEGIAKEMRGWIAAEASRGGQSFADASLGAGAFNGIPAGIDFFAQQQAAHDVFVQTINGVVADLEQFGDTLAENAANHRAVDESNADSMNAHEIADARAADALAASHAMNAVNSEYDGAAEGQGLASEQAYDENREGNEALDVETEHDGGTSATDGADTAPPTDTAPAPEQTAQPPSGFDQE